MSAKRGGSAGFPELVEVERVIREALQPAPGRLEKIVHRLLEKSGKMLRPQLLLTCAALAGGGKRPLVEARFTAAAVEIIHNASLVHDDIIDESSRRRGQETLHQSWGAGRATLAGDLLLARAFALLSRPGSNKDVLILLAGAVALLCRGEICQMNQRYRWETTERQYHRINYFKTAQFMASCCEAGGWVAGAAPVQRRAMRLFGLKLGQAFQIIDDILDYTGDPDQLGKPARNDLEQGRATLPLIHLFATRKEYLKLVRMAPPNSALPRALQQQLCKAVTENGSLDYALDVARKKQAEAINTLQIFPPGPERRLLAEIAAAVTGRLSANLLPRLVDS